MARYARKTWRREELLSWVGSMEQIAGARQCVLRGGKAEGVQAIEIYNGGGLRFTVLPGRGMDIAHASFRETPLGFISGTGITSAAYYEEPGLGWLRGFYAGLLTTCGIGNAGAPSADQGRQFGLHGRLSNAGAEDVCIRQGWSGDEYLIQVSGRMREAQPMAENLRLERRIQTLLGSRALVIEDEVENCGFEEQPLMLMYHCNFGWPLLGPASRVVGPFAGTRPRDDEAAKDHGVRDALIFPEPAAGFMEKVYYHDLAAGADGRTFVALVNEDCPGGPLAVVLRFSTSELPRFTQWKMPRQGFYVLGLEPGTVNPDGRGKLRERGELPMLGPLQSKSIRIEIEVLDTAEEIERLESEARRLARSR